jgi:hypothetical protein
MPKSRRMRLAEGVTCMGHIKDAYIILVGRHVEKKHVSDA